MSAKLLGKISDLLHSDKVRERAEGFEQLSIAISKQSTLDSIDSEGDGKDWLFLYQAVFSAIAVERTAWYKKKVDKKLADVASRLRDLVQKTASRISKQVLKALVNHLIQTMVHKDALVEPVALDYAKSLVFLFQTSPLHLDHLETKRWVNLLYMCFSVLLGRRVVFDGLFDDDEGEMEEANAAPDEQVPFEGLASPRKRRGSPDVTDVLEDKPSEIIVTPVQVELANLVKTLMSSTVYPYMSTEFPHLVPILLKRFRDFLFLYSPDTSIQPQIFSALTTLLRNVSYNYVQAVTDFGHAAWKPILALFSSKHRHIKEDVIVTMKLLLPFVTSPMVYVNQPNERRVADNLRALTRRIQSEAENRTKTVLELLSLDHIRLQHVGDGEDGGVYCLGTMRSADTFTCSQALTWAMLELQADCTLKLHQWRNLGSDASPNGKSSKRMKYEPPIPTLVDSIRNAAAHNPPIHKMQHLLFLIGRHWAGLDLDVQRAIFDLVRHHITLDDFASQNWAFLCVAAIAYASRFQASHRPDDWRVTWTSTIKRLSGQSRAACHAAYSMMSYCSLDVRMLTADCEDIIKGLSLQGPAYPFDSACSLMRECTRVVRRGMQTYKLNLEEKIMSWLTDNWGITHSVGRHKRDGLHMDDILQLANTLCSFHRPNSLNYERVLPSCTMVHACLEWHRASAIRNYVLNGVIGDNRPLKHPQGTTEESLSKRYETPSPFARKFSDFLVRRLSSISGEGGVSDVVSGNIAHDKLRRAIDVSMLALGFQASMRINGYRHISRVLKVACGVLDQVHPLLVSGSTSTWNTTERAYVLGALDPLTLTPRPSLTDDWSALTGLARTSGVSVEVYDPDAAVRVDAQQHARFLRFPEGQTVLWTESVVQTCFASLIESTADLCFRITTGNEALRAEDDFVKNNLQLGPALNQDLAISSCARKCISLLTTGRMLQSPSLHPIRDNKLIDVLLLEEDFVPLAVFLPLLLDAIFRGHYALESTKLDELFDKMRDFLMDNTFSRNESLILLLIETLRCTMSIWTDPIQHLSDIGSKARDFVFWVVKLLEGEKSRSWKVRDQTLRLLDEYLRQDPTESFWNADPDHRPSMGPSYWIWSLSTDIDIRVRFRSAVATPCLFIREGNDFLSAKALYECVSEKSAQYRDQLEHILTCLLCMGNIMISSAEIRRLPYQDLLLTSVREVRLYDQTLQSILVSVVRTLSIPGLRKLSDTYIASASLTFLEMSQDLTNIPPSLLGYETRQSSAKGIYLRCLPGGFLYQVSPATSNIGHSQLKSFCRIMQLEAGNLLPQLFPSRISMRICMEFDSSPSGIISRQQSEDMWNTFETWATEVANDDEPLSSIWDSNIDVIIFDILRTIGEVDASPGEGLCGAIESSDFCNLDVFLNLTRFRETIDLRAHRPEPPAYTASAVLKSLEWITSQVASAITIETVYHVLQRLFDAIGDSILINDQIRYLDAMCLLIASRSDAVKRSQLLLRRLLFGSSILISQSALTNRARSIFHWASEHYERSPERETRYMECLVRVSRASYGLSISPKSSVRSVGSEAFRWIEQLALNLHSSATLGQQTVEALTLWPTTPGGGLEAAVPIRQSDILMKILGQEGLAASKFQTTRRLHAALGNGYDLTRFLTRDFWHLKSSIPEDGNVDEHDSRAFLDLLFRGGGRVMSNTKLHLSSHSIGYRHQKACRSSNNKFVMVAPDQTILLSLIDCLYGEDVRQIHLAYEALRRLLPPIKDEIWASWKTAPQEASIIRHPRLRHDVKVETPDFSILQTSLISEASLFQSWIASVTQFFCNVLIGLAPDDTFYSHFHPILAENSEIAVQLFPVLVHETLRRVAVREKKLASSMRETISAFFNSILVERSTSVQAIRSIIDTFLHLRNFEPHETSNPLADPLAYEQWLDLDPLLLSQGAANCGSFTTALLILELRSGSGAIADPRVEQIMYDIYGHIEEPDGFYGIPSHNAEDFLMRKIQHEKQWAKALSFHGAQFEARPVYSVNPPDSSSIVQAFHCFGLDRVADVLRSAGPSTPEVATLDLDLGWRTENWDLPVHEHDAIDDASLYLALKSIHCERDPRASHSLVRRMTRREFRHLRALKDEDHTKIESSVRRLLCLREANNWVDGTAQTLASSRHEMSFHKLPSMRFGDLEAVVSTRLSLLRAGQRHERESNEQIGNILSPISQSLISAEISCLLELSAASRNASLVQLALNAVTRARALAAESLSFQVAVEFAKVLWSSQEQKIAVDYLMAVGERHLDVDAESKALLLTQIGEWVSHASLQPPMQVRDMYFEPAYQLITVTGRDTTQLASVPYRFASFAEHQYLAISRSDVSSQLRTNMARKQQEIDSYTSVISSSQPDQRHLSFVSQARKRAETQFEQDSKQFSLHMEKMTLFLHNAIVMYSRCLVLSDGYDRDSVIHLCSLWFRNFEDEELNRYIEDVIDPIPSRKFIFFAHQLSARLSGSKSGSQTDSPSQRALQRLILRLCREHPFHGLYQVYALQHNYPAPKQRVSSTPDTSMDPRTRAAETIFNSLRDQPTIGPKLRDVELVCDAYVEWATHPIDKQNSSQEKKPSIPVNMKLRKLKNINIPVPTLDTPVDPTCTYGEGSFVGIREYKTTYTTAGGVNLPKICDCYGSDGNQYKQLFKGQGDDDLRQDAVMEQVFDLVNHILQHDAETKRRSLRVRTYKVIPLTYRSGVLEFVSQTIPLSRWLLSAHKKYHPKDYTLSQAATKLSEIRKPKQRNIASTASMLHKEFLRIRERLHPVLRHFFTESHKSPTAWFDMRLRYARSVATTSIVGHMMGIGDRHISNILLDQVSGEVVHIDFGIAFDQGKLLNIPETVPFRLTADIVDGLGMAKTEGVFRRCAEETLRVLRENSEVFLTVLEVFKNDPLHSWTATPRKLKKIQGTPDDNEIEQSLAEDSADRALRSVKTKLDKSLSVEYSVNELIAIAIDPANLSMIFSGWNPHA